MGGGGAGIGWGRKFCREQLRSLETELCEQGDFPLEQSFLV